MSGFMARVKIVGVIVAVLAVFVGMQQPVAFAGGPSAVSPTIGAADASASSGHVAAPEPMTMAQRKAQISKQDHGMSPRLETIAEGVGKAVVKGRPSPRHVPPAVLRKAATRVQAKVSPAISAPASVQAFNSVIVPGYITLDVGLVMASDTTAANTSAFQVVVYDSNGDLLYGETIQKSVTPGNVPPPGGDGYCYGWWQPNSFPASLQNECFWEISNSPGQSGGVLVDGGTYYVTAAFEDTSGNWTDNTVSNGTTVFYVPGIPGAAAGVCTCYTQNSAGDPVDTATGTFHQQVTDATLPGAGATLALTRSYRSDSTASGLLGPGWSLPFDAKIVTGSGNATLYEADGSQIVFTKNSSGAYAAPAGVSLTLTATSSGFTVRALDHSYRTFNSTGQLATVDDASGHGLSLSYTSGHLASVTDAAGRTVAFSVGSTGLLSKVGLPDGRSVSYVYTSGRLTGVTDLAGGSTGYSYDGSGRLTTITDPLGKVVTTNTYDASSGRITSQTDGTQDATKFTWDASFGISHMTDPKGGIWTDEYTGNVLSESIDPYGNTVTYTYDRYLNLVGIADRRGNTTSMTYDSAGNMLSRTSPAPLSYTESWTYDSSRNVTSHKDANGNTTTYAYTSSGQLATATDPTGGKTTYAYTALGQLASVTSPRGEVTSYGYDSAGNRISTTTPAGEKTTFTFDGSGRITAKTDPRGNAAGATAAAYTTSYTYDNADHVTSVKDPLGSTTTYGYDADGRLTSAMDGAGLTTSYGYDADGRRTSVTDPDGKVTTTVYDVNGNVSAVTDPAANKTTYTYDSDNRRASMVTPRGNLAGASASAYTWTYGYDANGNQTTVTDPVGDKTTTTYDALNRSTVVTDPLGHTTTTTYDADGDVASRTDAASGKTSYGYDKNDRLVSEATPRGGTWTYAYDADGNKISQTDPANDKTSYTYDADERLATTVDPRGNASGASPAAYTTTYNYDPAGNQTKVTDPLGDAATTAYSADNEAISATDPAGQTTTYAYDADGRLTTITAPDTGTTGYTYDDLGDIASRTDANVHKTTYTYDADQHLTSTTDPLGDAVSSTYDADGNKITTQNARGQTTTYTYDARDLLTTTSYSDGTPSVTDTYDAAGRLTGITDATGTRTLGYDTVDRLTSVTSGGTAFSYTYDAGGDITARTYPDGEKATYAYDSVGRETSQTADGSTTGYAYDAAGDLITTTLPTGTNYLETRAYDAAGRLTQTADASNGAVVESYSLTLDASGRPTKVSTDHIGAGFTTQYYTYDTNGRLTQQCSYPAASAASICPAGSSTIAYTYDKVGNRLTQTTGAASTGYTYNAADELTAATTGSNTTAYTYDADGNQTAAGANSYTYNAADQLASATVGGTTTAYTYDAEGDRVTASQGGSLIRKTAWDINNQLPQAATDTTGTGALIADYHTDPLGEAQSEHLTGGTYYYHHNWLGSTTELTSSTGTAEEKYTYDAFGAVTQTAASGAPGNPYLFAGQYQDSTTGTDYNLKARTYDPTTGRFTSPDPLPQAATTPYDSSYAYANNAPTYLTDPSGQDWTNPISQAWNSLVNGAQQFGSGFVEGVQAPFKFAGDLYDAATGANGGWGGFVDKYIPIRPAYRLFTIADILRQQGCAQLADQYDNAASQLLGQAILPFLLLNPTQAAADTGLSIPALEEAAIPQILTNKAAGDAAADAIAAQFPGSRREAPLPTSLGWRRIDVLTPNGLAIESKVGRVSLTKDIRTQIAKDEDLLRNPNSGVKRVEWVFSTSSTTGKGGPTPSVAAALEKAGITWTIAP